MYFSFTPNAEMMDRTITREKWHAERRDRFVKRKRVNAENDRTRFDKFRTACPSVPKMPCPVNVKWRNHSAKYENLRLELVHKLFKVRKERRMERLVAMMKERFVFGKHDEACARIFLQWVKDGETEEQFVAPVAKKMKLSSK